MPRTTIEPPPLSADVELAEQSDRAGAHDAAINHLVAGARKKDIEALTRLGKRLLVGDRAPHLPNDGASLLAEASERGGAEAAAMLAVLYAVGVHRGHDLRSAVATLALAAERGWPAARAQLAVLAGGEALAESTDWRATAKTIDVAAWQTVPAAIDLCADPLIRSYPGIITPPVARWLIEKARGRLTRALVYEALIKKTTVHHTRTNTAAMFNLLDTDLVCVLVQNKMCACLGVPFRHLEPMTVLHYDEGEEITEHFDFIDPNVPNYREQIAAQGQRRVTFLVYLNDDYSGGETEFPRLGVSHKGAACEGMYFVNALADGSSDRRTLHAGRPPTHGDKWIVSQFVRNHPTF